MPRIIDVEQGSPEWFAVRRGVITATCAQSLLDTTKAGRFTAQRGHALAELAMERLDHSGKPQATGAALRRGHEFEQEAIDAYIFETGYLVESCGFALHDKHDEFGCSPDGLIGEIGMVQIKVPTSVSKHVDYLQTGSHADEYKWQVWHELYVMDRKWSDVVSYNPESAPEFQLAIKRLHAPSDWTEYEKLIMAASSDADQIATDLMNTIAQRKAA